jgi:hypothetical protein
MFLTIEALLQFFYLNVPTSILLFMHFLFNVNTQSTFSFITTGSLPYFHLTRDVLAYILPYLNVKYDFFITLIFLIRRMIKFDVKVKGDKYLGMEGVQFILPLLFTCFSSGYDMF